MNVNLGCGPYKPEGWINIDADPQYEPDVLAMSWDLPFADESIGCVYAGHVLEHMTYDEQAPATLREIKRVLHPGGRLLVVGPDYDMARRFNADEYTISTIENIRPEGEPESPGWHQWTATAANTLALVQSVFPEARLETSEQDVRWCRDEDDDGRWKPVASAALGQLAEEGWFIFSMVWWQVGIQAWK